MTATSRPTSYEQACAEHRWEVPERYNIAADVCDRHPRDKLALIHEDPDGNVRRVNWGEIQDNSARFAAVLAQAGVRARRPGGDGAARRRRRRRPRSSAPGRSARSCSRCRCSTATRASATASSDSQAKVLVTDAANADRIDRSLVEQVLILDDELLAGSRARVHRGRHRGRGSGPALLLLGDDRPGQGHPPRPPLHPRPRGVRLLPRRPRRRGVPRHGGVGVGGGHLSRCSGPWRFGAVQAVLQRRGGFDPHRQLDFLSRHEVTNVFATPTAIRSMMSIADAGTRYPQRFRIVCSAGEPLNPEAIRWFRDQYGVTVLDYYGLTESYPLCANYPFMEVREGSMGRPMPGWEVAILDEDERPVAQGERGEICLRARSNPHYPLGYWNRPAEDSARGVRRRVVPHQGRGLGRRGRLLLVRGAGRRRDHLRRLPDRPVRGRVGVPRAPGGRRGGRGRVARRAPGQRGQGVRRARRRPRARPTSSPRRSRRSCATTTPPTPIPA